VLDFRAGLARAALEPADGDEPLPLPPALRERPLALAVRPRVPERELRDDAREERDELAARADPDDPSALARGAFDDWFEAELPFEEVRLAEPRWLVEAIVLPPFPGARRSRS
jgi:hypothetical protein